MYQCEPDDGERQHRGSTPDPPIGPHPPQCGGHERHRHHGTGWQLQRAKLVAKPSRVVKRCLPVTPQHQAEQSNYRITGGQQCCHLRDRQRVERQLSRTLLLEVLLQLCEGLVKRCHQVLQKRAIQQGQRQTADQCQWHAGHHRQRQTDALPEDNGQAVAAQQQHGTARVAGHGRDDHRGQQRPQHQPTAGSCPLSQGDQCDGRRTDPAK